VIVVPPGSSSEQLDGPVVALTDLDVSSAEAYLFAAKLARLAGRRVVPVHVVAGRDVPARTGPPCESSGLGESAVLAWAAACGLPAERAATPRGEVVEEALAFASAQRAMLIVAGWQPRRGLDGVLGRSVGRALAAKSTRPIAIVPSGRPHLGAEAQWPAVRGSLHA
jgi:nucleotide-binding universal stress UspA family protein